MSCITLSRGVTWDDTGVSSERVIPSSFLNHPLSSQCSPGMLSPKNDHRIPTPFFLPGLIARGKRATLPTGIRITLVCLAFRSRVAHFFLPASAEEKRARETKLCCCSPRWLAPDSALARLLLALRWLPLKNLSLSAAVSQALRTNTAAGRAFFVSNLLAQPPRVA